MKNLKSIELFTGAGGLALGLEKTGWHHLALVERNRDACETIRLNETNGHPLARDWRLIPGDVRSVDYGQFGEDVDMVAGGPPCQPFSLGGKHRAFRDDRDMFPQAVRAVRELRPRCFVFENVKGLLRQSFATYFSYIVLQLSHPEVVRRENEDWQEHLRRLERVHTKGGESDLCYRVVFRLLNAAEYGVPQFRHRVFIVGFRTDIGREWSFPSETHTLDRLLWDQWVSGDYWEEHELATTERPELSRRFAARVDRLRADHPHTPPPRERFVTVRDALKWLPDPRSRENNILNHEHRPGARPYKGHTGSPLDEPSKTLKAGDHGVPGGENMMVFPNGKCRYYTVREAASIQTFPKDYAFSGSWTEAMRQVGNAVPVQLAEIVGRSIHQQVL